MTSDKQQPTAPAWTASICAQVANLIKPSLTALPQVLIDTQAGVREERARLISAIDDTRQDGFEAAARLMLSVDTRSARPLPYFQQLQKED